MVAGSTAEGRALRAAISECCQSGKLKTESGKRKVRANERNAKFTLAFHCECSRGSSTRSVVKTENGKRKTENGKLKARSFLKTSCF